MNKATIIALVILVILIGVVIALYFIGRRLQKRQAESAAQIEASKMPVNLLIIDKKKLPLNKSGLPDAVIAQTPKLMRRSKVPVVKAKAGPQVMTLIADDKIFDSIPTKTTVRAMVSGIYIVEVRSVKGGKPIRKDEVKKSRFKRMVEKLQEKTGAKPL